MSIVMKNTLYKVCVESIANKNKTVVYSTDEERLALAYVDRIKQTLSTDNEIYIEKEVVSYTVDKINIIKEGIEVVKTKWFRFNQNNSGGYYIENDEVGQDIWVEAVDKEHAINLANEITENYSEYCGCCGRRWSTYHIDDVGDEPLFYGEKASTHYDPFDSAGYGVLHFLNGQKEKLFKTKEEE